MTHVFAIVSVNHGAGETPAAGLWKVRAGEGVEGDAGRGDRERSGMKWLEESTVREWDTNARTATPPFEYS